MKFSPPKKFTFWIAVALGVVGVVVWFIPVAHSFAMWVVLVGLIILALGNLLEGL